MTRLSPPHPLRVSRPSAVDVLPAVLCVIAMHVELVATDHAEGGLLATTAIVLASAPLVLRRQVPIVAFALSVVTLFAVMETSNVYNTMCAPIALCAWSVADRHGRRAALVLGAGSVPLTLAILQTYSPHPLLSWSTASYLALVAVPLALGVAAHDRRAYTSVLVERAEAAERTREEEALRRVDEERLRIARDVHDVVAHAMVTINVQAGVGAYLLRTDPDQAHTALRTIKQLSGDALTDLRAVLGLLRSGDAPSSAGASSAGAASPDVPSPAPPVQHLSELDLLREGLAAAGVHLTVDIDPDAHTLPASIDATGYRIVQEAMTNTLRHAGRTTAHLRISRVGNRLLLEIDDDGTTRTPPPAPTGTGNGLRGMRERAAAIGGWLEAGPRSQGGWRVTASLPLDPAAREATGVPAP